MFVGIVLCSCSEGNSRTVVYLNSALTVLELANPASPGLAYTATTGATLHHFVYQTHGYTIVSRDRHVNRHKQTVAKQRQ